MTQATAVATGMKQVSFDRTCHVIPDGTCKELRKVLALASRHPSASRSPAFEPAALMQQQLGRLPMTVSSTLQDAGLTVIANSVGSGSATSSGSRQPASQEARPGFERGHRKTASTGPLRLTKEEPGLLSKQPSRQVDLGLHTRSRSLSHKSTTVPRKSCLLRHVEYATPIELSKDADVHKQRRRRPMGPPVVNRFCGYEAPHTGLQLESKLHRNKWQKFRRAASEGLVPSDLPPPRPPLQDSPLSIAEANRELLAGRWPFECPLKTECVCKGCQDRIEQGLSENYQPAWTKAARIKWLEAQGENDRQYGASAGLGMLSRSTSRGSIQADEVDKLRGESITPMTAAELEAETASPVVEHYLPECVSPCGPSHPDEALRLEILAKRNVSRPTFRPGARSMLRQLEEAEREESEAASVRSRSRDVSPQSTPALTIASPSTANSASSFNDTPSYFDIPVRSHNADKAQRKTKGTQNPNVKNPFKVSTMLRALSSDTKPSLTSSSRFSSLFR